MRFLGVACPGWAVSGHAETRAVARRSLGAPGVDPGLGAVLGAAASAAVAQLANGVADLISTAISLPLGAVYVTVSPMLCPSIAAPSGDVGE
ncbi:hypothetical protein ISCU110981_05810 [Isoptericola cucumis]